MALLDVLSIVFDADATKLKKGAGEAEKVIEDTKEAVIDTDKAAEKLGASFLETIGSAKGSIAGLLSLGAITASVVSQAAATDQLGKFSQRLGVNIEDLGAWGEAVKRSGGSMEEFQGTVETLNDNITEIAKTGGGAAAEAFARLGISAVNSEGKMKGVFDLLPELADRFEGLSKSESIELGQRLGLDKSTMLLLQQGRGEVDKLVERQRSLGLATAEDAAIAATFNDAMDDMRQVFGSLTRNVGAYLLPAFTTILKGIESVAVFIRNNEDFVIGFFLGVASAITYYFLPAALSAAAAGLLAISPFLGMAAIVAGVGLAFALLYDDIQTFLSGGDSVIGLIQEGLIGAFESVKDTIFEALKALRDFYGFLIGSFLKGISTAFDKVSSFFGLGGADSEITDATKSENLPDSDPTDSEITDATKKAISFFGLGGADSEITDATKKAKISIEQAESNPLSGQSAQALQQTSKSINRNTTVSVAAVNVDARGGNSEEISAGIGTALQDEMKNTVSNFDDGIAL